jgi:hypothetical protein
MFIVIQSVEMGLDEIEGRDFGLRGDTPARWHRAYENLCKYLQTT